VGLLLRTGRNPPSPINYWLIKSSPVKSFVVNRPAPIAAVQKEITALAPKPRGINRFTVSRVKHMCFGLAVRFRIKNL
jgi:hypothetical protein